MEATFLVPGHDDVRGHVQLVPRVGDQVVLYDDPQAYEVESVTWKVPEDRVMIKLRDWRRLSEPVLQEAASLVLEAESHE